MKIQTNTRHGHGELKTPDNMQWYGPNSEKTIMTAVTNMFRLGIATAIFLSGSEIGFTRDASAYPSNVSD